MKFVKIIFILVVCSSWGHAFWGDGKPSSEAFNFMKDSKFELYGCTTILDGMKEDFKPNRVADFSMLTMAQSLEEAKVKIFDKLHVDLVLTKGKYVLRFRGSGSVLKDLMCVRMKDLI